MTCFLSEIGESIPTARLTLLRGDSWDMTVTVSDAQSVPIDLSTAILSSYVMKNLGGEELFAPEIVMVDATLGKFIISITSEQSISLTAGVYDLDCAGEYWLLVQMTAVDGRTVALFKALIHCVPGSPQV